jgi:hypothetical protein
VIFGSSQSARRRLVANDDTAVLEGLHHGASSVASDTGESASTTSIIDRSPAPITR